MCMPQVVRTPVYQRFDEGRYRNKIPMSRMGAVEDIVAITSFWVSDDTVFTNRAAIPRSGGQSL